MALTPFVVVFAIIPFSIYAHSGEDWGFRFAALVPLAGLGLAIFAAAAVLIRLLAAVHEGSARTVAAALFCLGLFLLLAHVYAPIQIGPLDGSAIESTEPVRHTIVELVMLAGVVLAFVQLRRGRGLTLATAFSVALVLVAVGYAGVLAVLDHGVEEARAARPAPRPTTEVPAPAGGNVYHIVLDRMPTDVFRDALAQAGVADAFTGFELFENNVANYLHTTQSAASYFTGTYFDGEDYKAWMHGWYHDDGLLPAMAGHGYRVWMYAPIAYWDSEYVDILQYNVDIYEQETGLTDAGLYDLLHVWLASLAPNPLTNEALPVAGAVADATFELLTGRLRPLSGEEGLHPYAGVKMLGRLVQDEDRRASAGEYVYAHAVLPHGPLVLDRDCRYVGSRRERDEPVRTVQEAFVIQATCAVGLVATFLDDLKRRGRYDAATIVIHGDTATWIPFGEARERRGRTLGYPTRSLLSYVRALLMIKRPHATGPLEVLATPTQLVDLYPTLLDLLDLPPPKGRVDGRSIYGATADPDRDTRIAIAPKDKNKSHDLIEVRIEDPLDVPRSKLTILGPVGGSGAPPR